MFGADLWLFFLSLFFQNMPKYICFGFWWPVSSKVFLKTTIFLFSLIVSYFNFIGCTIFFFLSWRKLLCKFLINGLVSLSPGRERHYGAAGRCFFWPRVGHMFKRDMDEAPVVHTVDGIVFMLPDILTSFLLTSQTRWKKMCSPLAWVSRRSLLAACLLFAGRAFQMEDDLVISFQLLLCTLEFCIKRCPRDLLQPLYSKEATVLCGILLSLSLLHLLLIIQCLFRGNGGNEMTVILPHIPDFFFPAFTNWRNTH